MTRVCLVILFCSNYVHATTISSRGTSGNWTDTAQWTPAQIPLAGDSVVITNGSMISVTSNVAAKSIRVLNGGDLPQYSNTITLTGTLQLDATGRYASNSGANVVFSGTGNMYLSGLFNTNTIAGNFTLNSGTLIIRSGTVFATYFSGAFTLSAGTVQNNGDLTFNSATTCITLASGSTWIQEAGSRLVVYCNITGSGSLDASGAANNFAYYGNSGGSIFPSISSYANLYLGGGGTYQINSNTTLSGNFIIAYTSSAVSFNGNGYTLHIAGNFRDDNVSGTVTNAVFDFNGFGSCSITSDGYRSSITIPNVTISGSETLTLVANLVVPGNLNLNAGTLSVSSSDYSLTVGGNWTNNGGSFWADYSSSVTFNPPTGTSVVLKRTVPGNDRFAYLNFSGAGTVTITDTLRVGYNITISSGTVNASTSEIRLWYGWNRTGGVFNAGTSTVKLCRAGPTLCQIASSGGSETFYNLVDSTSTNTGSTTCAVTCLNNFTIMTGTTFTMGGALTVNNNVVINSGGTLNAASYALTVSGNWTNNSTINNLTNVNITFNASSGTQTISKAGGATEYFNNVTVAGGGTVLLAAPVSASGNLTIDSGSLDVSSSNYSLTVVGNWNNTGGTFIPQSGTVYFSPSGTSTVSKTGGSEVFYGISKTASGTFKLASNISIGAGGLAINNGTIDGGSASDTLFISGDWNDNHASGFGSFTPDHGTVVFQKAGTQYINSSDGDQQFNNIYINNSSGTTRLTVLLQTLGDITVGSTATFDAYTSSEISAYGNYTNKGGTFIPHNCDFVMRANGKIGKPGGTENFYQFQLVAPGGTTTLTSNITVSNLFYIQFGTLKDSSFNITVSGIWQNTGGIFNPGTGTVIFNGSGAQTITRYAAPETFNNIQVNSSAYLEPEVNITCTGNLVCGGGSIDATGYNSIFFVQGNFDITSSVFVPRHGMLVMNGNGIQTITGTATYPFYNLMVNKPSGILQLNSLASVSDTLWLKKGEVTTTSTNILKVLSGATVIGGGDTAYISGPLDKVGNSAFTFPLGSTSLSTGAYHPLTITAPSSTTDEFVAQYYPTGQTYGTTRADSIEGISACEYWTLNHTTGTSSVSVGLNFNTNCPVQGNANISLASWNGTTWLDRNGTKSFGNWPKGSVTMTSPMSVSGLVPFALIYKQITGGYAELKRKLDGGYFIVPKGTLYFKFDDEYNSGSPHLTYQLYNGSRQDLSASLISYDPVSSNPVTIYGDNRFGLDMSTSGGALSSGYYVLEVTNEKSEKRYLRVKMP